MSDMKLDWVNEYNLLMFEELDSTSLEALRLAKAGVEGKYVIWAREQNAGKGQRGKSWLSPAGNLYMSILFCHEFELEKLSQLSFVVANALYDAITELAASNNIDCSDKLKLKWPNDIMVGDKKLAGILVEHVKFVKEKYIIIGIGLNCSVAPYIQDKQTTSLQEMGIKDIGPDVSLDLIINNFNKHIKDWKYEKTFKSIRKTWLERAYKLDEIITIDNGQQRLSGRFREIDIMGSIVLELSNGQMCHLSFGEVLPSSAK